MTRSFLGRLRMSAQVGIVLLYSLSSPLIAAEDRLQDSRTMVFAHYMVCCSFNGPRPTVEQLTNEMELASSMGIDGFALNAGAWRKEPEYAVWLDHLFDAADRLNGRFWLFLSIDNASTFPEDEAVEAFLRYKDRRSQLKVGGKPLISTYGTDVDWLRRFNSAVSSIGQGVVLIPQLSTVPGIIVSNFRKEVPDDALVRSLCFEARQFDGIFFFGAAGPVEDFSRIVKHFARCVRSLQKSFIAPVVPFYRGIGSNRRMFEANGFERMEKMWMAAIKGRAAYVEIVTWNDWGEGTYVRPFRTDGPLKMWRPTWPHVLSHSAFLEASRYFIEWFKSGSEPIVRGNSAYVFFRGQRTVPDGGDAAAYASPKTREDLQRVFIHLQTSSTVIIRFFQNGSVSEVRVSPGIHDVDLPFVESNARFEMIEVASGAIKSLELPASYSDSLLYYDYTSDVIRF